MDKLEARLQNTEKALYSLATILIDIQPTYVQEAINEVMSECFNANETLGSKTGSGTEFIKAVDLEANNG